MRIAVSRSGGIAGLTRRGVLDVDARGDADAWLPLAELAAAGPPPDGGGGRARDTYVWTIEVDGARAVVPDAALPEDLRALAQRTLDEGSPLTDPG